MRSAWGLVDGSRWTTVAFALAVAATVLALSQAAGAAVLFEDPRGDSGPAPDIAEVEVGNDVIAGPIVIWVETPNRPNLTTADGIGVFFDSDLNPNTGDARTGGIEFLIDAGSSSAQLFRWNGSDFVQVAAPSLRAEYVADITALRIEIHPNELGGTRGFNFWLLSLTGESTDVAPDGSGLWTYSLIAGPVRLSTVGFRLEPGAPRAGRTFTASMRVVRGDINEITTAGALTCTLRIGRKTIRATLRRYVGDRATCRWRIPAGTAGQRVSGSIAAAVGGATARRPISTRVRR
jgi:hypothetical protein